MNAISWRPRTLASALVLGWSVFVLLPALVFAFVACGEGEDEPDAPARLIEIDPTPGSEIPRNQVITLTFDKAPISLEVEGVDILEVGVRTLLKVRQSPVHVAWLGATANVDVFNTDA